MQIIVTRVEAHRYSTVVERDDGTRLSVPGYGFMRALPHDLAHCVVEAGLGLDRGFWGSVADGAEFRGMQIINGRRKPHATDRARTVAKANDERASEAERLVACFEKIIEGELDKVPERAEAELREATAAFRRGAPPISRSDIAKLCTAWRLMQTRWNQLPIGQSIRVEWRGARSRRNAPQL